MTSRQAWLRDPERERSFSKVDPRPVEAACLDAQDSMRDMVREYVDARRRKDVADELPDDEFLSDEELDLEGVMVSPYEVVELEASVAAQVAADEPQDPLPVVDPKGVSDAPEEPVDTEPPAPNPAAST